MGLHDFSKSYTPNENTEGKGFDPFNYSGMVQISGFRKEEGKYGERVVLELTVPPDIKDVGNRKIWKNYATDQKDAVERLCSDLFTAGLAYDFATPEAELKSFDGALNKMIRVRCSAWTPEKDRQGNEIPEEARNVVQTCRILSTKKTTKGATKTSAPF